MRRRPQSITRFSRDYRRPPRWGMGLPPRRQGRAPRDPRGYLRAVVLIGGLVAVLPAGVDLAIGGLRPMAQNDAYCRVYRVVDGDTVRMWCTGRGETSARLMGFDTPELFSPQCGQEFVTAWLAKWVLRIKLLKAREVAVIREGTDRYDRALVKMFLDGQPIARQMIEGGFARAYDGGRRQGWCDNKGARR